MTNTQTSDDIKTKLMIDAVRAYERAPDEASRKKAAKDILKAGRIIGLNDAETDTLAKILAQPGEIASLTTKTILELAQKKSDQLIDLQRQWSNAFMRQGDSVANIAGLARMLATVASLFGANDWADMLHAKADAEMTKAETQYARARGKMEQDTGTTNIMRDGLRDSLKTLVDKSTGYDLTGTTKKVGDHSVTVPQRDAVDYGDDEVEPAHRPAAPAANQKITWQQFHENMKSVGVDQATQEQLLKLYEKTAKYDETKDVAVIDSGSEGTKLISGIKRTAGLTDTQKAQLQEKLRYAAPELIPS